MRYLLAFPSTASPLQKKVERFPARTAIQDTDELSSDGLIEEGRPLLRRLSFFLPPSRPSAVSSKLGYLLAWRSPYSPRSTQKHVLAEKAQK